jgi:hypothetical protein
MAWTTPKTWSAGETLTAANFNTHIRDNGIATMHLLARKSADETVNNSTVLQNDDHLFFTIGATEAWLVEAYLMVDGGSSSSDFQVAWTVPASATMLWAASSSLSASVVAWETLPAASTPHQLSSAGTAATYGMDTTITGVRLTGIAAGGGTSGTVQLQWAQGTAVAEATILKQNSCLVGVRLA